MADILSEKVEKARPLRTERVDVCPNCGGQSGPWTTARDRLRGVTDQVFRYSKCRSCGALYQSERILAEEVDKFYPSDYGPHQRSKTSTRRGRLPKPIDRFFAKRARGRLRAGEFYATLGDFYAPLKPSQTLLDFGCGAGEFLDQIKAKGVFTIGMDFAPLVLEQVAGRGHRTLPATDEGWAQVSPNSIDIVRMNHVVEHLYDPRAVLRRAKDALVAGGRLHLATPNPESLAAEKYRDAWFSLDCPRHIILFPPAALVALLKELGFADISVKHEPNTKDLVRSWGYRQADRGALSSNDIENLDDDGFLSWRFSAEALAALRAGRSDRYHVFAVKP